MLVNIQMPAVEECDAQSCSYNRNMRCHARGITIGDTTHPACDTFVPAGSRTNETKRIAGVGACKVVGCRYNDDLECSADSIKVGHSGNSINCRTYDKR